MIIGREKELQIFNRYLASNQAEFLAVYGRRRIGKTFIIHEFFKDKGVVFEITGVNKAPKNEQLKSFSTEMKNFFNAIGKITDWSDAFNLLLKEIEKIDSNKKFIFFIDELPWLASPKSGFLRTLDYYWNRHFSRMPNVLVVICGSAAHWIITKVINDTGGLHNRLSAWIRLEPFTLLETEQYLSAKNVPFKRKELIELYMTFGGVAKYLTHLPSGRSPTQIINEYCFTPSGFLFSEFSKLYESLFDHPEKHIAVVRALAKKQNGLIQSELLKEADLHTGGTSTKILEELEESGFIISITAFDKQHKERMFRLIDEYSLFYLSWIHEAKNSILASSDLTYWHKKHKTAEWYAWSGHAFENICFKHISNIKKALGIGGIFAYASHWQYHPKKNSKEQGAEIDLVIDRSDNCINLCEIKFCDKEFEISNAYAKDLERKMEVFQTQTGTKKTLFLTLITPYGLKQNAYSIKLVHEQLTLDALF